MDIPNSNNNHNHNNKSTNSTSSYTIQTHHHQQQSPQQQQVSEQRPAFSNEEIMLMIKEEKDKVKAMEKQIEDYNYLFNQHGIMEKEIRELKHQNKELESELGDKCPHCTFYQGVIKEMLTKID